MPRQLETSICRLLTAILKSYEGSAIDSQVELFQDVPLPIATRISVSDMFYVQPVHYKGAYFAGGIIDLMPIELAEQLGETIIFEKKKGFGTIDEALIRAVFGYSGNRRLQEVMTHSVNYWVDTADMNQALSGHYIEKKHQSSEAPGRTETAQNLCPVCKKI